MIVIGVISLLRLENQTYAIGIHPIRITITCVNVVRRLLVMLNIVVDVPLNTGVNDVLV